MRFAFLCVSLILEPGGSTRWRAANTTRRTQQSSRLEQLKQTHAERIQAALNRSREACWSMRYCISAGSSVLAPLGTPCASWGSAHQSARKVVLLTDRAEQPIPPRCPWAWGWALSDLHS